MVENDITVKELREEIFSLKKESGELRKLMRAGLAKANVYSDGNGDFVRGKIEEAVTINQIKSDIDSLIRANKEEQDRSTRGMRNLWAAIAIAAPLVMYPMTRLSNFVATTQSDVAVLNDNLLGIREEFGEFVKRDELKSGLEGLEKVVTELKDRFFNEIEDREKYQLYNEEKLDKHIDSHRN